MIKKFEETLKRISRMFERVQAWNVSVTLCKTRCHDARCKLANKNGLIWSYVAVFQVFEVLESVIAVWFAVLRHFVNIFSAMESEHCARVEWNRSFIETV